MGPGDPSIGVMAIFHAVALLAAVLPIYPTIDRSPMVDRNVAPLPHVRPLTATASELVSAGTA